MSSKRGRKQKRADPLEDDSSSSSSSTDDNTTVSTKRTKEDEGTQKEEKKQVQVTTIELSKKVKSVDNRGHDSHVIKEGPNSKGYPWNEAKSSYYPDGIDQVAGTMLSHRVAHANGLFEAIHFAFADERELTINPAHFWLIVMQIIGLWMNKSDNPQKFRKLLGIPDTPGNQKILIRIDHDGLERRERIDIATLKWAQVFPAFEEAIRQQTGNSPAIDAMCLRFECSTPDDMIAQRIALMDSVSQFFNFEVRTRCGIPRVKILGSKYEWLKMVTALTPFMKPEWGLAHIIDPIQHVLTEIANCIDAPESDHPRQKALFESIYKYHSMSGGYTIDGWSLLFVPFRIAEDGKSLENTTTILPKNHWKEFKYVGSVYNIRNIMTGVSKVDFIWDYYGTKYPMRFLAGFAQPEVVGDEVKTSVAWLVAQTGIGEFNIQIPTALQKQQLLQGVGTNESPFKVVKVVVIDDDYDKQAFYVPITKLTNDDIDKMKRHERDEESIGDHLDVMELHKNWIRLMFYKDAMLALYHHVQVLDTCEIFK